MNEESRKFVEDPRFDVMYYDLYQTHKPIKPEWKIATLQEIGNIVARFQRLEMIVRRFIGSLLNISHNKNLVVIITANLSFRNSMLILLSVAKERNFPRLAELDLAVKKALKAEEIRNQIVHSVWGSGPRVKTGSTKDGVKVTFERYEDGELARISQQIDHIDTAIDALHLAYMDFCYANIIEVHGVNYIRSGG